MRVLVVAAMKGGVGKTTLAGHLGVEAERCGDGPVAFIDADPQGTLTDWWRSRNAAGGSTTLAPGEIGRFEAALRELRRAGASLLLIDTGPGRGAGLGALIRASDMVLIPTRPSPHDLRAVGRTLKIAKAFGKPTLFVVNGATRRARLTGEAAIVLSQHGEVSPVIVHHRVDFAGSMIDGRTVGEANAASPGALEISQLWKYVNTQMLNHVKKETRNHVDA